MKEIAALFGVVKQLQEKYPTRRFTPDGRLVGDLGEVLVVENYKVTLYNKNHPKHDGFSETKTGERREVQIKATFKEALTFPCNEDDVPAYYIGIKISEDGSIEEVYNGPGAKIWDLVKSRKPTKISLHMISNAALRQLNNTVKEEERIEKRP